MKVSPRLIAIITLLVYWSPWNGLYYFWGFFLFFFILIFKRDWAVVTGIFSKKIVRFVFAFVCLFFLSFFINYFFFYPSLNNFFWSVLTYGSTITILLALLMVPFKEEDVKSIFKFSLYLTLIEIGLGYFQMLQSQSFQYLNPFMGGKAAGDFFVGTTFNIGLGSFVAIKVSLVTLLFIPVWIKNKTIKNSIFLLLLFVGWVLASALFTLIIGLGVALLFFLVKKLIKTFYSTKINKSVLYVLIISVFAIGIFSFTQRNNIMYFLASMRYTYATLMGTPTPGKIETRKIIYYKKTLADLPIDHPSVLLIGIGPGNYSSRSAWLVSGEYLLHQPAYLHITPSDISKKYVLTIWSKKMINEKFKGAGSIIHQPFSSWLSVFAEMGIVALLVFFFILNSFYRGFNFIQSTSGDSFLSQCALGLKICLVYIGFLFFIENLFEYPIVMGQFFIFACAILRAKNI